MCFLRELFTNILSSCACTCTYIYMYIHVRICVLIQIHISISIPMHIHLIQYQHHYMGFTRRAAVKTRAEYCVLITIQIRLNVDM